MNNEYLNRTLQSHFKTQWGNTPVAWENAHYPSTKNPWVRFQVLPSGTEYASVGMVGAGVKLRNTGIIAITAYVPTGTGQKVLLTNLDIAGLIFFGQEIGSIQCFEPSLTDILTADGWHQASVLIPFQYDSIH